MKTHQSPGWKIGILTIWMMGTFFLFGSAGRLAEFYFSNPASQPVLSGPNELCIVFGAVIGTYNGGGEPSTDVYYWEVRNPSGELILERTGGNQFEQLQFSFQSAGTYQINLKVRRNSSFIYTGQKNVSVRSGPELAIQPDYLLCGENPAKLVAIKPDFPNLNQYQVKWKDALGNLIGNSNSIEVLKEGAYFFEITTAQGGCLITGNTYVGPPLDYSLKVSATSLCKGSEITLASDTPLSGEWFLISPGSTAREPIGTGFELILKKEQLALLGTYTAIFSAKDPENPSCLSTRKIDFEVKENPVLEITVLKNPDNCALPNGQLQIKSLVKLDSLIVEEAGKKWFSLVPGALISLDKLAPQLYTITAYSSGCKFVKLFNLESKNPPITNPSTPNIIPPVLQMVEESCGADGVIPGKLRVAFSQGNVTGKYRILAEDIGEIDSGEIINQSNIELDVPGGIYYFELKIDDCTYPINSVDIPKKPLVNFSVPSSIAICEKFDLIPDTNQELIFTLTYPDKRTQTVDSGKSFTLEDAGDYQLLGIPKDPSSGLCPKIQTFKTTINQNFDYSAVLIQEDCFGNQIYQVALDGITEDQISIRWLNETGTIVGRGIQYFSSFTGQHTLEVQPLKSGFCATAPYAFFIDPPILSVNLEFKTEKICPDPGFAQIALLTSKDEAVESISWIFFDDGGNRRNLDGFSNQFTIVTDQPGNYEAVVFNRLGCEIGRNFTKVEVSTLLTLPAVESKYGICSKNKKGPSINPGLYKEYRWFFEERLISEEPIFSPEEIGSYILEVATADGCIFTTAFTTYDLCFFEYRITNAMILSDQSKEFEIWINEEIASAEVHIFNRKGELIFYEKMKENPKNEPTFSWNGQFGKRPILPGTYAVVLQVSNPTYNFFEKVTKSLLVIE
jgi:hypothetical protein